MAKSPINGSETLSYPIDYTNHVSKCLSIDIRHNYVTRLCSIGIPRRMIQKLDLYLDVAMSDLNDVRDQARMNTNSNG